MSYWDEIEINHIKITDLKEVCGTILPNETDIIAGLNNRKFILRPMDHSKMKHYQMLAQGSSSTLSLTTTSLPTSTSRKRPATTDTSAEPLQSAFSKKSVKGMLSTSADNTMKAVNTKKNKSVYLLFNRAKGRPLMMNVGQMLDPRINLGDPSKDLVQEWAQNHCVILSGVNTNTACSYHVTYAFQSESTLFSCLNVKEFLARNRREI